MSQRSVSPTLAYLDGRERVLGNRVTVTLDPDDIAEKLSELAGGPRRAAWLMRQALRSLDRWERSA